MKGLVYPGNQAKNVDITGEKFGSEKFGSEKLAVCGKLCIAVYKLLPKPGKITDLSVQPEIPLVFVLFLTQVC